MRGLMCIVIAVSVFLVLGIGYLIYPDEIERCVRQDDAATAEDAMVFVEFISIGFFLGFYAAARISRRLGRTEHARRFFYDRKEIQYVLLAINGLLFIATGSRMLQTQSLHGKVHIALGVVLFLAGIALGVRNQLRAGKA